MEFYLCTKSLSSSLSESFWTLSGYSCPAVHPGDTAHVSHIIFFLLLGTLGPRPHSHPSNTPHRNVNIVKCSSAITTDANMRAQQRGPHFTTLGFNTRFTSANFRVFFAFPILSLAMDQLNSTAQWRAARTSSGRPCPALGMTRYVTVLTAKTFSFTRYSLAYSSRCSA